VLIEYFAKIPTHTVIQIESVKQDVFECRKFTIIRPFRMSPEIRGVVIERLRSFFVGSNSVRSLALAATRPEGRNKGAADATLSRSQVPLELHASVQNANDDNAALVAPEEQDMAAGRVFEIPAADIVA
jgi:hypothetical protein